LIHVRNKWNALVCSIVVCTPASAWAQSIEAGGTVGTGARGTESKLARQEARLVTSLQLSGWWADRLETGFRIGWIDLPDISSRANYYHGCQSDRNGRCLPTGSVEVVGRRVGERRLVAGQVLYHFRTGKKVRPHVGLGFGKTRDTEMLNCEPSGCEVILSGLPFGTSGPPLGKRSSTYPDQAWIAGVSTLLWNRVVLRGGVQIHNFAGEERSLTETSVQVGYRFRPW
jgi:hypothetical protein